MSLFLPAVVSFAHRLPVLGRSATSIVPARIVATRAALASAFILFIHTVSSHGVAFAGSDARDAPGVVIVLDAGPPHGPVLTLFAPRPDGPRRTPLGEGWRHDFDIVLTASGTSRTVYDRFGRRHGFVPTAALPGAGAAGTDGRGAIRYRASIPHDGELSEHGSRHVWRRDDGAHVIFAGSLPVSIEMPDGTVRTLRYADGKLLSVSATDGATLHFAHERDRLRGVSLPDGTRWRLTPGPDGTLRARRDDVSGECTSSENESSSEPHDAGESRCDTNANPTDGSFLDEPGIPGAVRIDARPASCRSYFADHTGTARGTAIESGLDGLAHYAGYTPTVRSFPIADFVGEELRIVRSRDLASPSYDGPPDALYTRLLSDGDDIVRQLLEPLEQIGHASVSELGRTTVLEHDPARPVVLELVVRHGFASGAQMLQIERARRELFARHGILLRVIEIP